MKTRFLSLLFLFVAAFITLRMTLAEEITSSAGTTTEGISPGDFHQPQTDAEKALDSLLQSDKNYGGLLNKPGGDFLPEEGTPPPVSPFTEQFILNLHAKERQLGGSKEGEKKLDALTNGIFSCGLGYSREYNNVFHTIEESDQSVVVMSVRREAINTNKPIKGPVYRLVKDGEFWQLDGVVCEDANFNTTR